jgi:leader peptidase (prepilin peptidase) / N-methyltransferase
MREASNPGLATMNPFLPLLSCAGLAIGSFATVVAHRVPRGESIVTGRSRCPSCGATIAAYDNVPVFSWLVLRGHCRGCGERISPRYPLTELAMAALFAATVAILGTDDVGELVLGLALCAVLVTVTLTDLERRVIPNTVLLVGALVGAGVAAASDPGSLPDRALAAAGAGGFLLCVALAYPRGMGMGDVKLAAVMGLYLGRAVAPALLIGFAAGAVVGLVMIARKGAAARKQAIPFGPFLALGGIVGLWYGDAILDWYLDSFFRG